MVKLISASAEDLQMDSRFKVTKNERDPILIEFETFRGLRKATPSFLFAFLIRWSLDEIKKIAGETPKFLEFCFDEINETIKNNILEACKKLDLEARVFDRSGLKAAIAENEVKKIQRLKKAWFRPLLALPSSKMISQNQRKDY